MNLLCIVFYRLYIRVSLLDNISPTYKRSNEVQGALTSLECSRSVVKWKSESHSRNGSSWSSGASSHHFHPDAKPLNAGSHPTLTLALLSALHWTILQIFYSFIYAISTDFPVSQMMVRSTN